MNTRKLAVLIAVGSIAVGVAAAGPASAAPTATPNAKGTVLILSQKSVSMGFQRVGTFNPFAGSRVVFLKNAGSTTITLTGIAYHDGDRGDFLVRDTCFPHGRPATLVAGATCKIGIAFLPRALGRRTANLHIAYTAGSALNLALHGVGTEGYYLVGPRGGVGIFGDAVFHGQKNTSALTAPIIAATATTNGAGYWLLGGDGGIFAFGNAGYYGSTGNRVLNQPVVGMAHTKTGRGYWLVARDGGIFSFGDAKFFGSTGGIHLNQPIVGMAVTPTGKGYWLVASDGGIFSFGDAKFSGSTGAIHLNQPIVGMAATPSGKGYWLVARDGGIFAFGDAGFFGSVAGGALGPIVGMASSPDGHGYWMSTSNGAVYPFGDAPYYGDLYTHHYNGLVGIAPTAPRVSPRIPFTQVFDVPDSSVPFAVTAPAGIPHVAGN